MKILRIGDPHIKPNNLADCESLMAFVDSVVRDRNPDRIEILGDLFHTHAVVRLEVLEFWDHWINLLLLHKKDLYVLVGNHDRATADEFAYSALSMFRHIKDDHLKIVEIDEVDGLYAYIAHFQDPEGFISVASRCAARGAKVLVCHQTFAGAKYEAGFLAPDGIDANLVPFDNIISGHIHSEQTLQIGNKTVFYQGTPKWDTVSDANENKGVWLYEHDDMTGAIVSKEMISTAHVVTPIISLVWKEGSAMPIIPARGKVTVELVGTSAWVEKKKNVLKGEVAIKSQITDRASKRERKTGSNFPEFITKHFVTDMDRQALLKYMEGLNLVY